MVGVVLIGLAVLAPAAGATYARVEAVAGCDGVVTWRASASSDGSDDERTNTSVLVEFRTDRDRTWRAAGPVGAFEPSNDFAFGGTVELPEGSSEMELRVTPQVRWGADRSGDQPGSARFATASVPEECEQSPLVVSQNLDCDRGVAVIEARNVGDAPLTTQVLVDQVEVRSFVVDPDARRSFLVPVLKGRDARIQVASDGFVASDQILGADCDRDEASAVVLERCGAPAGRLAVLVGAADDPVDFEILVDGTVVDSGSLSASEDVRRTLGIPGGAVAIQVTIDDRPVSQGTTGGCEGSFAGLLACGGTGLPACGTPVSDPYVPTTTPPSVPPTTVPAPREPVLPHTGPAQRAVGLLLGGLLLAVGGMTLGARDRRRPTPSVLADAIAPYRQRWWDQH